VLCDSISNNLEMQKINGNRYGKWYIVTVFETIFGTGEKN